MYFTFARGILCHQPHQHFRLSSSGSAPGLYSWNVPEMVQASMHVVIDTAVSGQGETVSSWWLWQLVPKAMVIFTTGEGEEMVGVMRHLVRAMREWRGGADDSCVFSGES